MRNYVVGISGTHGTGKSFLSRHLEPHIAVDRTQLSRTAQKELGWDTLSRAEESEENVWALQNAILDAMIKRDAALNNLGQHLDKPIIAERTPADLYAYTRMWLVRLSIDPRESQEFKAYHARLVEAIKAYRQVIMIFPHESIPFVAEPNRADEKSRQYVNDEIISFLVSGNAISNITTMVFQHNIDDRVNAVLKALNMRNTV